MARRDNGASPKQRFETLFAPEQPPLWKHASRWIVGLSLWLTLGTYGCKKSQPSPLSPTRPTNQQPLAPPEHFFQQPIDTPRPTEAAKRFEQDVLRGHLRAFQKPLTDDQLAGLGIRPLYLAQQTYLARHQQHFRQPWVQQHFARFSWYKASQDNAEQSLSSQERANQKRITQHLDRALERAWLGRLGYRLIEDQRSYSFCGDRLYALATQTGSPDGSCCTQKAYGNWTIQDGHLYLQQSQRCESRGSGSTSKGKEGPCIRYTSCTISCKARPRRHLLLERRQILAHLLHKTPIRGALRINHEPWSGSEGEVCQTARKRLGLPSRTSALAVNKTQDPTQPQATPSSRKPKSHQETSQTGGHTAPSQTPPRTPQPTQWASDAITGPSAIFDGWWDGDHRYVMSFHAFGEPFQKVYWSRQCTFTRGSKQRQTSLDKNKQLGSFGWYGRTTVAYSRPDERGVCRFAVQIGMVRQQKLIHFPREDGEGHRNHIRFFYRWYKRTTKSRQLAVVVHVQTNSPKRTYRWSKSCNLRSASSPQKAPYKYRQNGRDKTGQHGWSSRLILLTTHTDYDGPCALSVVTPGLSRVFHHNFLFRDDMKD